MPLLVISFAAVKEFYWFMYFLNCCSACQNWHLGKFPRNSWNYSEGGGEACQQTPCFRRWFSAEMRSPSSQWVWSRSGHVLTTKELLQSWSQIDSLLCFWVHLNRILNDADVKASLSFILDLKADFTCFEGCSKLGPSSCHVFPPRAQVLH